MRLFRFFIVSLAVIILVPGWAMAWVHWTGYSPGFPVSFGGDSGAAEESSVAVFPIKSGGKWYTEIIAGDKKGYVHRVEVEVGTGTVRTSTLGQWPAPIKAAVSAVPFPSQSAFESAVPITIGFGATLDNSVPGGAAVRTVNPMGAGVNPDDWLQITWDELNQDEAGDDGQSRKNGTPDGQFGSFALAVFDSNGLFITSDDDDAVTLSPISQSQTNRQQARSITPQADGQNDPNNYWALYGGTDHRIYVRNVATGQMFNDTFPYYTQDTILSTPLAYDINNDGVMELLATSDLSVGSLLLCDRRPTWAGGRFFALDLLNPDCTVGQKMIWEYIIDQVPYSAPVVGDIDGDGQMEMVAGDGPFYDTPAFYVYALNAATGALKWRTALERAVRNSPALADLDGDGAPEVIVGCDNGKVYALNGADGSIRWETALVDRDGITGSTEDARTMVRTSPVVADMDGDGDLEIFVSWLFEIIVLDHNGAQLTGPGDPTGQGRIFLTQWSLFGSPAIYDIDGDGFMNLVVAGGDSNGNFAVYAWPLTAPVTAKAPWPTFRRGYSRRGVYTDDTAYNLVN